MQMLDNSHSSELHELFALPSTPTHRVERVEI